LPDIEWSWEVIGGLEHPILFDSEHKAKEYGDLWKKVNGLEYKDIRVIEFLKL